MRSASWPTGPGTRQGSEDSNHIDNNNREFIECFLQCTQQHGWLGQGPVRVLRTAIIIIMRELYSTFRDSECLTTLTECKHGTQEKLYQEKEKCKWHNNTINILILTNKKVNGIIIQQTYLFIQKCKETHTSLDQIHAHIQFHTYMHTHTPTHPHTYKN